MRAGGCPVVMKCPKISNPRMSNRRISDVKMSNCYCCIAFFWVAELHSEILFEFCNAS